MRGADLARDGWVSRLEADDPPRQFGLREFDAERVEDTNGTKLEQWAGVDLDENRGRGAIAISLGGAREGRDVARSYGEARTVDRDRHDGVVVARAPQRVDDRREIALGAARQGFAVGRSVLAQPVER